MDFHTGSGRAWPTASRVIGIVASRQPAEAIAVDAEAIRRVRRRRGFSQRALAQQRVVLDGETKGLSESTIRRAEEDGFIRPDSLRLLAALLRVPTEDLLPRDPRVGPLNLPPASARFVGRAVELSAIHELLSRRRAVALHGAPGIGKSELAIQLAMQLDDAGHRVLWFDAADPDLTRAWSGAVFDHLELKGGRTAKQRAKLAVEAIDDLREPVLLVLDGLRAWRPYPLPSGKHIRLLVTTWERDIAGSELSSYEVSSLLPDDGRDLLTDLAPSAADDGSGLSRLLTHLDGYTLAVELAGAFLREFEDYTPSEYLVALRTGEGQQREAEVKRRSRYGRTIADALTLLWNRLGDGEEPVRRFWQLASQFAAAPGTSSLGDEVGLDRRGRGLLRRFNLIRWDEGRWSMHALIQHFGRAQGTRSEQEEHKRAFFDGCAKVASGMSIADGFRLYLPDQPHFAKALLYVPEFLVRGVPHATGVRAGVGLALHSLGDFDGAERLHRESLDSNLQFYGEGDPKVAIDRSNLGLALRDLGDLEGARWTLQAAVSSGVRSLGEDDPSVAIMRSNLATLLGMVGAGADARPLLESALDSSSRRLGDDHLEVAVIRSNLGMILHDDGDFIEAREHTERALESAVQARGEDHPHAVKARANLAAVLRSLGDLATAEYHASLAVAAGARSLGEDHNEVTSYRALLAQILSDLGDSGAAESHAREALKVGLQHFPTAHPVVSDLRSTLAMVLLRPGGYREAHELLERALAADIQSFGEEHRRVVSRRALLASAYAGLGNWELAEKLAQTSVEDGTRVLGGDHPRVAELHLNLARIQKGRGDLGAAQGSYRRGISGLSRSIQQDHPILVAARAELARVLLELDEIDEASALLEGVLGSRRRVNGPDTLEVAEAQAALGRARQAARDFSAATKLFESALECALTELTEHDPKVLEYRGLLARTLQLAGHYEEARAIFELLLSMQGQVAGEASPEYALAQSNLATVLVDIGEYDRAEELLRRAVATDRRHFGAAHLKVAIDRANLAEVLVASANLSGAVTEARAAIEIVKSHEHQPSTGGAVLRLAYGALIRAQSSSPNGVLLPCPGRGCEVQLRVPSDEAGGRVMCPGCRSTWAFALVQAGGEPSADC